jgi:hypothetical protein
MAQPKPPMLTDLAKRHTPGELFWILKHGIKMSDAVLGRPWRRGSVEYRRPYEKLPGTVAGAAGGRATHSEGLGTVQALNITTIRS